MKIFCKKYESRGVEKHECFLLKMNKKVGGENAKKLVKKAVWRKRNLSIEIFRKINFEKVAQK